MNKKTDVWLRDENGWYNYSREKRELECGKRVDDTLRAIALECQACGHRCADGLIHKQAFDSQKVSK